MTKHDDNPPTSAPVFIDLARVMELTGRSKSAIYEDPTFPLAVSFSEPGRARRHARWLLHEVEAWLRARSATPRLRSAVSNCAPNASAVSSSGG
jgi:predicted DNA-binding transcriptional regulator AlpA